eukprot:1195542-Prorocentrum_minimum.AAC.6
MLRMLAPPLPMMLPTTCSGTLMLVFIDSPATGLCLLGTLLLGMPTGGPAAGTGPIPGGGMPGGGIAPPPMFIPMPPAIGPPMGAPMPGGCSPTKPIWWPIGGICAILRERGAVGSQSAGPSRGPHGRRFRACVAVGLNSAVLSGGPGGRIRERGVRGGWWP